MAIDCSKLTDGVIAAVCNKPAIAGTGHRVILINYNDIDRSISEVEGNVIKKLVLKTGATGYEYESLENSTLGEISLNKGTYFSNWQHDLTLRVFAKSESSKGFVNSLNSARVVAVVDNKELGDDGDVKYEVYGWDAGLELNEGTASTDMADLVVYTIKMGSGANSKEASLPKSIFDADLATTETMLNTLLKNS